MRSKIAFLTPRPMHSIYQNNLVFDEMKKRGWDVTHNNYSKDTTHLFVTSNSQWKAGEEAKKKVPNAKIISWLADISYNPFNGWEDREFIDGYIKHIRDAWRVISICEGMRWEGIKHTGRKIIELVHPCVDTTLITKILDNQSSNYQRKNQFIVVGAMSGYKESHIPFLAWKLLPKPRPDLIYISYGLVKSQDDLPDGNYDKKVMGINGLLTSMLMTEAHEYKDQVKFLSCDDPIKFQYMIDSKALIMPSSFGTFNLPPIEAWFCGTPSIVSSDHWYTEYEDSVIYYKTNDIRELRKQMNLVSENIMVSEHEKVMWKYTIQGCCDNLEKKWLTWRMIK